MIVLLHELPKVDYNRHYTTDKRSRPRNNLSILDILDIKDHEIESAAADRIQETRTD